MTDKKGYVLKAEAAISPGTKMDLLGFTGALGRLRCGREIGRLGSPSAMLTAKGLFGISWPPNSTWMA